MLPSASNEKSRITIKPLALKKMEKLKIDRIAFMMAFSADADFHVHLEGQVTFLDKCTGCLEYSVADRGRVAIEMGWDAVEDMSDADFFARRPEQYLEISGMPHGLHHQVLQEFLASDWVSEQKRRDHATNIYYSRRSIGYWLKSVGDQDAIDAYFLFKEHAYLRLAQEFLSENGVTDFEWT